ncbi:hypothetical protein DFS34DRAFT_651085 [Phlyctochytrium arcticum]|nr:hypothetical protein DFS34DRAFT_651085 [Phlyctochytrium arcticum]
MSLDGLSDSDDEAFIIHRGSDDEDENGGSKEAEKPVEKTVEGGMGSRVASVKVKNRSTASQTGLARNGSGIVRTKQTGGSTEMLRSISFSPGTAGSSEKLAVPAPAAKKPAKKSKLRNPPPDMGGFFFGIGGEDTGESATAKVARKLASRGGGRATSATATEKDGVGEDRPQTASSERDRDREHLEKLGGGDNFLTTPTVDRLDPATRATSADPSLNLPSVKSITLVQDALAAIEPSIAHEWKASPPPPSLFSFGPIDLAQLLDVVLLKMEADSETSSDTTGSPQLDARSKTQSHIITELGRRIDKAQKSSTAAQEHIVQLEALRAADRVEMDRLQIRIKEVEETATQVAKAVAWSRGNSASAEGRSLRERRRDDADGSSGNSRPGTAEMAYPAGVVQRAEEEWRLQKERARMMAKSRAGEGWTRLVGMAGRSEVDGADGGFYDPFEDATLARKRVSSRITKPMIFDAAVMLSGKKTFDPPSTLAVGLKSVKGNERALSSNPYRHLIKSPAQLTNTSYFPRNFARLAHSAADHTHHLSQVLTEHTRQLLAASTPDEYLGVLQSQLTEMTAAVYMCLDVLAEEHRACEKWKWRCVKLVGTLERRKAAAEGEGGMYAPASGVKAYRRKQCLVNVLSPLVKPKLRRMRKHPLTRSTTTTTRTRISQPSGPSRTSASSPTPPAPTGAMGMDPSAPDMTLTHPPADLHNPNTLPPHRLRKAFTPSRPAYIQEYEDQEVREWSMASAANRAKTAPALARRPSPPQPATPQQDTFTSHIIKVPSTTLGRPSVNPTPTPPPQTPEMPQPVQMAEMFPPVPTLQNYPTPPRTAAYDSHVSRNTTHPALHGAFHHSHKDTMSSPATSRPGSRVPSIRGVQPFGPAEGRKRAVTGYVRTRPMLLSRPAVMGGTSPGRSRSAAPGGNPCATADMARRQLIRLNVV